MQLLSSGGPSTSPDAVHNRRLEALQQHAAAASNEARTGTGDVPCGLQCCHVDYGDLRDKVSRQEGRPVRRVRQSAVDNAEPHDGASDHVLQVPLVCVSR